MKADWALVTAGFSGQLLGRHIGMPAFQAIDTMTWAGLSMV